MSIVHHSNYIRWFEEARLDHMTQHGVSCKALEERGIAYDFGTSDFWGWYFLGSLVIVGPFIYFHKLCTAMNLLCEDYNKNLTAK